MKRRVVIFNGFPIGFYMVFLVFLSQCNLFDSVVYLDKNSKCKVISFAQIGLQERTKSMVGNAAALINGLNTFDGDSKKQIDNIR